MKQSPSRREYITVIKVVVVSSSQPLITMLSMSLLLLEGNELKVILYAMNYYLCLLSTYSVFFSPAKKTHDNDDESLSSLSSSRLEIMNGKRS